MLNANKNPAKSQRNTLYESYISDEDVEKGLENGLIKGSLRLNPRNYKEAYVTHHKLDSDVFIFDKDINRALFDDIVAIKINNKSDWKVLPDLLKLANIQIDTDNNSYLTISQLLKRAPHIFQETLHWNSRDINLASTEDFGGQCVDWWKYVQRTGKVVAIVRKMNTRHCVGTLALPDGGDKAKSLRFVKFSPTDSRFPRLAVPVECCPTDFLKRPLDYREVRFIAKVGDWPETEAFPVGEVSQCLKDMGVIEQETLKILVECGFVNDEFDEDVRQSIPNFVMTEADLKYRRDVRNECVISIDPKTARDLDDALHIKRLPELSNDGRVLWEVGIHIADVTYYVTPGSAIDREASNRTTTVYMVQKAIPMLPRELCENLCSLNPGTDKLAYSVVYQITDDCEIVDTWIGRTIIRTASKLSYEEAQTVLDNPSRLDWSEDDFSGIYSPFTAAGVASSILQLNHLAVKLRANRFDQGSLWINQPKLGFILNAERNCPLGFNMHNLGASNHLIEEWMLRANRTVAEFLHQHLPQTAFLRNHPPPTSQAIGGLNKLFQQIGWKHLSLESGSTEEFQELMQSFPMDDNSDHAVMMNICSKTMQLAQYFCHNSDAEDYEGCHHFALSVPLYTHFTSPIRRYPDMIVHRQLTRVLMAQKAAGDCNNNRGDLQGELEWMAPTAQTGDCTGKVLNGIAEWCNKKRKDAKLADDNSILLFYSLFVEKCGPFKENAVVVGVLDKAFDVLMTHCGFTRRVYTSHLDMAESRYVKKNGKLTIFWNRDKNCSKDSHPVPVTILTMLSCIDISVSAVADSDNSAPKLKLILQNPGCSHCRQSFNYVESDPLRDISSLQSDTKVIDEDRLYNILDDI